MQGTTQFNRQGQKRRSDLEATTMELAGSNTGGKLTAGQYNLFTVEEPSPVKRGLKSRPTQGLALQPIG
jgi:hypothetical protein